MDFSKLIKSKTFWAGAAGLLTAGGGYATGDIDSTTALQVGFTALISIFLRQGIEKSGPKK